MVGLDVMNEQEHRDALTYARAFRAAQCSADDFLTFAKREEMLGGLR